MAQRARRVPVRSVTIGNSRGLAGTMSPPVTWVDSGERIAPEVFQTGYAGSIACSYAAARTLTGMADTPSFLHRATRYAALAIVALVVISVAWTLGPGAGWLLRHVDGVHGLSGKELADALDAVRGRALAIATGLAALTAVYYTARNADTARKNLLHSVAAARRTAELTEQGQVTERYTKAIEQLGADKINVRIGGIFALERIANDSARDHSTVIEVLAAFIRERVDDTAPPADVQAALTVLGRRTTSRDERPVYLTGAVLPYADFTHGQFAKANFLMASLRDARMEHVDFSNANLSVADLVNADLSNADLSGADLDEADLSGALLGDAYLVEANLTGSKLRNARMVRVVLVQANLKEADLTGADLTSADLSGADLSGANLSGATLVDADLTDVRFTAATQWPSPTS